MIPGIATLLSKVNCFGVPFSDWQEALRQTQDLSEVVALFVRSTTRVDQALIAQLPALQFVASATSGIDHIDVEALHKRKIVFVSAKGSNAKAVADYVVFVLDALVRTKYQLLSGRTVVLGYGFVGKCVYQNLKQLKFEPQWADPFVEGDGLPLLPDLGAGSGGAESGHPQDVVEGWLCDTTLLCIHAPLTDHQTFPTRRWLSRKRLAALPDGAVVICAGQGETYDEDAVLAHAHRLHFVLDVFPGEPEINPQLVSKAALATPHIAGHSTLGKLKGAWQVLRLFVATMGFHYR